MSIFHRFEIFLRCLKGFGFLFQLSKSEFKKLSLFKSYKGKKLDVSFWSKQKMRSSSVTFLISSLMINIMTHSHLIFKNYMRSEIDFSYLKKWWQQETLNLFHFDMGNKNNSKVPDKGVWKLVSWNCKGVMFDIDISNYSWVLLNCYGTKFGPKVTKYNIDHE